MAREHGGRCGGYLAYLGCIGNIDDHDEMEWGRAPSGTLPQGLVSQPDSPGSPDLLSFRTGGVDTEVSVG